MRVRVKNHFSASSGRVGIADEKAWNEDQFWIPVVIDNVPHLFAKRDLEEV